MSVLAKAMTPEDRIAFRLWLDQQERWPYTSIRLREVIERGRAELFPKPRPRTLEWRATMGRGLSWSGDLS